jgi:hypothetical protein
MFRTQMFRTVKTTRRGDDPVSVVFGDDHVGVGGVVDGYLFEPLELQCHSGQRAGEVGADLLASLDAARGGWWGERQLVYAVLRVEVGKSIKVLVLK